MSDHHTHSHHHPHGHPHEHSHGHSHSHFHAHHDGAPRSIMRALIITLIFMVIEAVGGFIANSLALLSDAGHMLTDVGALLLSLFALWVARKPKTATMSFGYHRAEILGALASGLLIWMISGVLIYEAFIRLQHPEHVQGKLVFIIATIGLLANLASMVVLHGEKQKNINVRAAYLHLLTDSLGSVGAIVAGLILWLTGWQPIDPIITVLFAVLMLYSSWALVKEAVEVLMESAPSTVDPHQVQHDLESIDGVKEVHDLHIWSVSTGRMALSVHIITESPETVLSQANQLLESQYGIVHTTIQVEHPNRFVSARCYDCSPIEIAHKQ